MSWVRLVLVLAVALLVVFPLLVMVGWFAVSGARFGWVPSVVALAGFGWGTGWLAVDGRWARARRRTALGLAAAGAVIGVLMAHFAPPTAGRLRHAVRQFEQPGWQLVDDSVNGNALCFDACTSVSREYRVATDPDDVRAALRPVIARHRLHPVRALEPDRVEFAGDRGDLALRVTLAPGAGAGTTVYISADTR